MANARSEDMVKELKEVIEDVGAYEDYRKTQRKECFSLVGRMKLLVPLLEEISQLGTLVPYEATKCLCSLRKVLKSAKKLLKSCNHGSKIYLATESEMIMGRFHSVYDKISQALDAMPYDELGIPDEVKEQVRSATPFDNWNISSKGSWPGPETGGGTHVYSFNSGSLNSLTCQTLLQPTVHTRTCDLFDLQSIDV